MYECFDEGDSEWDITVDVGSAHEDFGTDTYIRMPSNVSQRNAIRAAADTSLSAFSDAIANCAGLSAAVKAHYAAHPSGIKEAIRAACKLLPATL